MLIRKNIKNIDVLLSFSSVYPEKLSRNEKRQAEQLSNLPRYRSWMYGRSALKTLLLNLNLDLETSQLEFPNKRISLSHCSNVSVAAGFITKDESIEGIGVDIELTRIVSDSHAKFYLSSKERKITRNNDDRIRLWTVKEALFKADQNNKNKVLSDFKIKNPKLHRGKAQNNAGNLFYYCSEQLSKSKIFKIKSEGWMSLAVSLKSS